MGDKSQTAVGSATSIKDQYDEEWFTKPEFIYGGPFVEVPKPSPLLNIATPVNSQLQGTFKKYVHHRPYTYCIQ